jgi:hypothetical protein
MAEHSSGTIRSVAWSEVFPWLRIVRAFRLAISVRALVLGAAGILLTLVGWGVLGALFTAANPAVLCVPDASEPAARSLGDCVHSSLLETRLLVPNKPSLLTFCEPPRIVDAENIERPLYPWSVLTRPARHGLAETAQQPYDEKTDMRRSDVKTGLGLSDAVYVLLCGLWATAVWALFGAAICRTAAVQLAADEQLGCAAALRFARRKWGSYFFAPLMPVALMLFVAFFVLVLGWIMRWDPGLFLGGLLWPLALAAGFVMVLLLIGVLFGWPLMWGAISAEGSDSFDALSRSYAYTFQRPLNYLFYAAVAGLVGWLGWLLVREFASGVIWMSYWAASWGSGGARIDFITGPESADSIGAGLVGFWAGCVKLLAVGYLFSYFWTASTAIYFLLRRDVDHTEMDEVFLDADQCEPCCEVPPIVKAPAGTPVGEGGAAVEGTAPHE